MELHQVHEFPMCGTRIHALKEPDLIQLLVEAKRERQKVLVLNHNLHSLYLYATDAPFRAVYDKASWIYVDGMPVIWLGRMAGLPLTKEHRITFLDCFHRVLDGLTLHGLRVFYLGSTKAVLEKGLARLRDLHPDLVLAGHHGYLEKTGAQSDAVIERINAFEADVLFVGMGMPVQELWLAEHRSKLRVCAMLTCGATLDYVTGDAYRPPPWAGRWGLYGLLRLCAEPRKLPGRYLVEPVLLAAHLLLRLVCGQTLYRSGKRQRQQQVLHLRRRMTDESGEMAS